MEKNHSGSYTQKHVTPTDAGGGGTGGDPGHR